MGACNAPYIGEDLGAWFFYLDKGLRLAPTCNQDTHNANWGDHTTGRTGVWLYGPLSREVLSGALSEGRCFATDDSNLNLWFELGGAVMGSRLPDTGDAKLPLVVKVRDGDESDSRYVVEVLHDIVGDGKPACVVASAKSAPGGLTRPWLPIPKG